MDPLARLLEMAGVTASEKKEIYIFIAGNHGSGKSSLVQSLNKDQTKAARSTFGYEYSSFTWQGRVVVNVIEVNETSPENKVLEKLAIENIDKSVMLFVFDIRHPNRIEQQVNELVVPFFEQTLGEFKEKENQKLLSDYYSTIASNDPISPAPGTMTKPTFLPTFFVASFDDSLADFNDRKFDGYLYSIRSAAVPYGAGVILAHSKSLPQIIISCAMREQIQEELRDKICERDDYFIPPSWDSLEKVNAVEKEEIEDKAEEEKVIEEKKVRDWQEFLGALSAQERETTTSSPRKRQTPKVQQTQESDFLSQFE